MSFKNSSRVTELRVKNAPFFQLGTKLRYFTKLINIKLQDAMLKAVFEVKKYSHVCWIRDVALICVIEFFFRSRTCRTGWIPEASA